MPNMRTIEGLKCMVSMPGLHYICYKSVHALN